METITDKDMLSKQSKIQQLAISQNEVTIKVNILENAVKKKRCNNSQS
jgi:hypothetical protein